jgi:hypothetical protein
MIALVLPKINFVTVEVLQLVQSIALSAFFFRDTLLTVLSRLDDI